MIHFVAHFYKFYYQAIKGCEKLVLLFESTYIFQTIYPNYLCIYFLWKQKSRNNKNQWYSFLISEFVNNSNQPKHWPFVNLVLCALKTIFEFRMERMRDHYSRCLRTPLVFSSFVLWAAVLSQSLWNFSCVPWKFIKRKLFRRGHKPSRYKRAYIFWTIEALVISYRTNFFCVHQHYKFQSTRKIWHR